MVKVTLVNVQGKTRAIGVTAAARELGVSRQFVHGVIAQRPGFKSKRVEAWLKKHMRRAA